jgi:hypothetical protein
MSVAARDEPTISVNITVVRTRSLLSVGRTPVRNSSISSMTASVSPAKRGVVFAVEFFVARPRNVLSQEPTVLYSQESFPSAMKHQRGSLDRRQNVLHGGLVVVTDPCLGLIGPQAQSLTA